MFNKSGNNKKLPSHPKLFLGCINVRHCITKDKKYFINIGQKIKYNPLKTLILMFWLICAFTIFFLYYYEKHSNPRIFLVLVGILFLVFILIWFINKRKMKKTVTKPHKPEKVNPVSVGTLYFSFALAILSLKPVNQNLSASMAGMIIFAFVISLLFIVGIYSKWIRTVLIPQIYTYLIGLTSIIIFFVFIAGMLSPFVEPSGIPQQIMEIIVYFGFAWLVTLLLVRLKEAIPQEFSFLFVLFFFCNAGFKFNLSDNIGGFALLIIGILVYLVAAGHLHPYGKVTE